MEVSRQRMTKRVKIKVEENYSFYEEPLFTYNSNHYEIEIQLMLYIYGLYPSIEAAIPEIKEKLADKSVLNLLNQWKAFSYE